MDGISTITQVERDPSCEENSRNLSQDEIFERRMSQIGRMYPLSADHDVSWLVANDECYSKLTKVIEQVKGGENFVSLDKNLRIKKKSVFPVLKGICLACQAVENVLSGTSKHAMCITKADGEIEREEEKAGFSVLSNAAIAAHYALSKKVGKVAIVEFDLGHQSMGSRELVAKTSDILLISVNVAGRGMEGNNGAGQTDNYKPVVIPKIAHRNDLERIIEEKVFAEIEKFEPDLIFLATEPSDSADSPWPDKFKMDYVNKKMIELADKHAKGRYILVLEGSVEEDAFMECQSTFSQKDNSITP